MDLFTIEKKGDIIFHGSENKEFKLKDMPCWFGLIEHTSRRYAGNTGIVRKYKINKNVKLLDVTNTLFHADYMARVNSYFANTCDTSKAKVLVPLGLPDLETQISVLGLQNDGIYPNRNNSYNENENKMLSYIQGFVPYIGHKHRYSVSGDVNLDKEMVEMMKIVYPNHDGYISPIMWPSYHLGGFLDKEMCLFNPITCLTEISHDAGGKRRRNNKKKFQTGGDDILNPPLNIDDLFTKYGIPYNKFIKVNPNIFE